MGYVLGVIIAIILALGSVFLLGTLGLWGYLGSTGSLLVGFFIGGLWGTVGLLIGESIEGY